MKPRKLGSTGIVVSEIGFGTWGIGGVTEGATSYGPTNDKESELALKQAFLMGIMFFDTSNIYGNGHSEELLGKVFRGLRNWIVIATKVGFVEHGKQDFSPQNILKSLEGSLRRLQTDFIDLLQLHSPDISVLENGEIMETLLKLKKSGKIRTFGISVRHPDDGIIAIEKYQFPAIQVNFSMADQRARKNGLLDLAAANNTALICRTPFNFGFLTGRYAAGTFAPSDHRYSWPIRQQETWAKSASLFKEAAGQEEESSTWLALRYCLSYKGVSSVIPGILTPEQAKENAEASDLGRLSEATLQKIQTVYDENNFFVASK